MFARVLGLEGEFDRLGDMCGRVVSSLLIVRVIEGYGCRFVVGFLGGDIESEGI